MGIKIKWTSLRFKLLTGILLISIILFATYSFYFFILFKNLLKYEEEKINVYLKSVSININKDIRNIIEKIKSITALKSFKNFNLEEMKDIVLYYENNENLIDNFFICDKYGNIIINSSHEIDFLQDNCSSYGFFKMPMEDKNIVISDNYTEKSLFISISAPIFSNDNDILGVIVIFLSLENKDIDIFQNIIDPYSYKWEILLTNKNGILLFHSHMKIEEKTFESIDYSNYPPVQKALFGDFELSKVTISDRIWYTSSELIPLCNWYVVIQVPNKLIINNVLNIITPNLVLLSLLIILLFIIIIFSANRFINPIVKLTNAIKDYGEKGASSLLDGKGNDEISEAMKTFNMMVAERRETEREILEIIERERKRIGKELHTELEDNLNGIYHQTLILREELSKFLKEKNYYIISYIEKISKILNETISKTKSISDGLSPVSLYEGGIINCINELAKNMENVYKVKYSFEYDEDIKIKDQIVLLNLYYIVHEAIQNAVKFNKSNKIDIFFKREKNNVVLKIEDYGLGILNNISEKKMSIRVMNYSARIINADLNIENKKDKGTITTCILKNDSLI